MNTILEIVLAFILIGSTLAFGDVQPLTYSTCELALFLSVLLLLLKQTREGSVRLPLRLWPVVFALGLPFKLFRFWGYRSPDGMSYRDR